MLFLDTESSPVTHQEERGGGWNVSGAGTWERGPTPCPSPLEIERGAGRGALSAPSSPSPFASKWRGGERVRPVPYTIWSSKRGRPTVRGQRGLCFAIV